MSVLFAILLFSVLIFVHELGHFAAAKLSGVQVNEFALFMGPAIWKKQIGETLYSIVPFPSAAIVPWKVRTRKQTAPDLSRKQPGGSG